MASSSDDVLENHLLQQLAALRASVAEKREQCAGTDAMIADHEASLAGCEGKMELMRQRLAQQEEADGSLAAYVKALEERREAAKVRLSVADAELMAAKSVMSQLEAAQRAAEESFDKEVRDLKQRYTNAKNIIASSCAQAGGTTSGAVIQRAEALQTVLAEQEHELQWLRDVLGSAQSAAQEANAISASSNMHNRVLSAPTRVVLPTASCTIPVPAGRMRRLTGPSGDGLHTLRSRYIVSCRAAEDPLAGMLQIELHGHINGVRQCAEEICALIR